MAGTDDFETDDSGTDDLVADALEANDSEGDDTGADDFETDDSFGTSDFEHIPEMEERRREEQRPLEESGEGESEGFELAEQELIENASHGNDQSAHQVLHHQGRDEEPVELDYGEADEETKADD